MAGDKSFLETMKPFHDKYASPTTLFAIGETGLGRGADMQARLDWLIDATSVETTSQMKYYVALSWVRSSSASLQSSASPRIIFDLFSFSTLFPFCPFLVYLRVADASCIH